MKTALFVFSVQTTADELEAAAKQIAGEREDLLAGSGAQRSAEAVVNDRNEIIQIRPKN